jgi:hypothetical protein
MACIEKDVVVTKCMAAVEASRRDHRGEREELSQVYWKFVRSMIESIIKIASNSGTDMSVSPSSEVATFLFSIARSGAITGVRVGNEELLFLGLSALALEDLRYDYRETLIEMTLLDHSARKLGADLEQLFKRIEPYCGKDFAEACRGYFSKSWRSLDAMGYRETQDRYGGFTYEQAW